MTYGVNKPSAHRTANLRRSFRLLLTGQVVSVIGSQVSFVALPLIAVTTLHASVGVMGVLGAVDNLPYLLLGLLVGGVVDRHRRRRLMIAADLLRAAAIASVPLSLVVGGLSFGQLCTVAFLCGVGNLAFDVACQAQLPELVAEDKLVAANGALQTSAGLAAVVAPGLVGLLITAVGGPTAMLVDTISYAFSAVTILAIRQPERHEPATDSSTWDDVRSGLAAVRRDGRLVGLAGCLATLSLAMNALIAVLMLYLIRWRAMDAGSIGVVFLAFGLGGAAGAVAASTIATRLGAGRVLTMAATVAAVGVVGFVAAPSHGPGQVAGALVASACVGMGAMAMQVLGAGLRQNLAPEAIRGRVLGTLRFFEWGAMPIGSLLGGGLGEVLGAPTTILVTAGIVATCAGWVIATPLRRAQFPVA